MTKRVERKGLISLTFHNSLSSEEVEAGTQGGNLVVVTVAKAMEELCFPASLKASSACFLIAPDRQPRGGTVSCPSNVNHQPSKHSPG